jgi:predicted ATPase with chaperone activity
LAGSSSRAGVARTVADLSGEEEIAAEHLAEALNYRRSRFVDR